VYAHGLPDGHVIYALAVVPGTDAAPLEQTFARMLQTLRANDAAAHGSTRVTSLRSGLWQ
jgi:hypothetical protein